MKVKEINIVPKLLKVSLRFLIILFAILLFAFILFFFTAERIINNNLSNYVFKKTDSIYRLEFENIDLNFKNKSISFSQVALIPDPKLSLKSPDKFYEFETSSLIISGIRLSQLFKFKTLSALSLKTVNPKFKLSSGQDVDFQMVSNKKFGLGDSIKLPFLNQILFDTILIANARMKMDTILNPNLKIPEVNLEIINFRVGGKKTTNTPFPFDVADISLKIQSLQSDLSDKIHQIAVDEVSLSLIHSKIAAKNITLKPRYDSLTSLENQYKIVVPSLEINSPYVQNFYSSDTIPIDKLSFNAPEIEIKFGKKAGTGTPLNQINLYKLIENDFRWININQFLINNAHIKFYSPQSNQIAQEFKNLNIKFDDFRIDPNSYLQKDRILSSHNLAISIDEFTLNHSDKVHQLVINNLVVDTKQKIAKLGLISFAPKKGTDKVKSTLPTLVNVKCKGASFKDVNFGEVYHHQILPMSDLLIQSPDITISLEKKIKKQRNNKEVSLLYEKLKDYIKGIYVNKTTIEKGSVVYNYISEENKSGFLTAHFNFSLNNLSVDSLSVNKSDKIFYANDFNVNFSDIRLQLTDQFHRLMTDSVLISSKGKAATIYNFKILPVRQISSVDSLFDKGYRQIIDISFPRIELYNTDLHKAFFQKELLINDFNVINPVINIDLLGNVNVEKNKSSSFQKDFYRLMSDYLFSLKISKLKMNSGKFTINLFRKKQSPLEFSNMFSVEMTNFELDSLSSSRQQKILFSDYIDLIIKNPTLAMADGVHKIDAKEIGILSSQNRIYISSARLYPDLNAEKIKKLPVTSFANLPSVEITGVDIHRFINNGELDVKAVNLGNPSIKLLLYSDYKNTPDSIANKQFILKGIYSFKTELFNINDGTLEIDRFSDMKTKTIANASINFSLNNFSYISNSPDFDYSDFSLNLKNANINLLNDKGKISVKQLNYKLSNQSLQLSGFSFNSSNGNPPSQNETMLNCTIPSAAFDGLNLKHFINKKEFIASSFKLNNPVIELSIKKSTRQNSFNPYRLNLYNSIKAFSDKIAISNVEINDASLILNTPGKKQFDNLFFTGNSFLVDKNSDLTDRLLSFQNINFKTDHIKGKTNDGFYNYEIGSLNCNSSGDFSIAAVYLSPVFPEAEFNRRKIYQSDCYTLNNINCSGSGLDIRSFIQKNEFSFRKANISIDNAQIYRNNHFPVKPGQIMDMPQKSLRNLKLKFNTDSISIKCGKLNYRELEPHSNVETKLFFTNIDAVATNTTNIDYLLKTNPILHLDIAGKLMDTGEVKAKLNLNIPSPDNKFDLYAECGKMPLNILNSVTEPGLKLSVKEGFNQDLMVNFSANQDSAHGELKFSYKDLKISLLSEKGGTIKEDKFISFLANNLAIKSENPRPGKLLIPVPAHARYDNNRSFINYIWRTTLSGIKNTFGLKEEGH